MGEMRRAPKSAGSLQELRSQIARGRYEVKPDRVAVAMLRRGLRFDWSDPRPEAPRG